MSEPGEHRYVIHLPVVTATLGRAAFLARALANSVTFLPEIDTGETTVSTEDQQGVHHRVFCDRLLDGGQRCVRSWQHPGRCLPRWP